MDDRELVAAALSRRWGAGVVAEVFGVSRTVIKSIRMGKTRAAVSSAVRGVDVSEVLSQETIEALNRATLEADKRARERLVRAIGGDVSRKLPWVSRTEMAAVVQSKRWPRPVISIVLGIGDKLMNTLSTEPAESAISNELASLLNIEAINRVARQAAQRVERVSEKMGQAA